MAKEIKPKTNIFVLDPVKGYGPEYIDNPAGMKWEYRGSWYYLYKRVDGILSPYEPSPDMSVPPEELYRVLRAWWPLVKKVFTRSSQLLDRIKVGLWVGIFGALLFFVFLIFTSKPGGA